MSRNIDKILEWADHCLQQGNDENAALYFEQAASSTIRCDKTRSAFLFMKAGNLNRKPKPRRAIQDLLTASRVYSMLGEFENTADALMQIGLIYEDIEEFKKASEFLRMAGNKYIEASSIFFEKGIYEYGIDCLEKARFCYKKVVSVNKVELQTK